MVDESRDALQGIRRSLIELYSAVGADPEKPQDVSRKFGINRNLTWKLSRVMTAADPFAALNHLPGQQGMELAVGALGKAGAPEDALGQVRGAMKRFIEVVDLHAGDRDQLELTLESMGLFEREYRLETGRELAFRGNCMIWGVQARTRLSLVVVGPQNADEITFVQIGGFIGFRRLRPNVRWRLMRQIVCSDTGEQQAGIGMGEIAPKAAGETPFILPEFSSPNLPVIDQVNTPEGLEFILTGGPVGAQGAFDCLFGYVARGLPRYRDESNSFGSLASSVMLPAETQLCDIIVHKSIDLGAKPELLIYGFPHGGIDSPAAQTVQNQLPHSYEFTDLVGSPPAIGTALVPRYSKLLAWVHEQMGWKADEFRGHRVQIPYPVMSSRLVARWPLPERPAGPAA